MNWNKKTKTWAALGMIASNAMVIIGWWIMKRNGGIEHSSEIFMGIYMGMMNFTFIYSVFIRPKSILNQKTNRY